MAARVLTNLSQLLDVDTTGRLDGMAVVWDATASKYVHSAIGVDDAADYAWTGGHSFSTPVALNDGATIPYNKSLFFEVSDGRLIPLEAKPDAGAHLWLYSHLSVRGLSLYGGGVLSLGCDRLTTAAGVARIVDMDTSLPYWYSDFEFRTPSVSNPGKTLWSRESSSTSRRPVFDIQTEWDVSTDATRQGAGILSGYSHAGRFEGIRVGADGTQAKLGFFGQLAVARPQVTASGVSAADLLTTLDSLGLVESI